MVRLTVVQFTPAWGDKPGNILFRAPKEEDAVLTVAVDPLLTRDKSFTAYNNLLTDRRPNMYRPG